MRVAALMFSGILLLCGALIGPTALPAPPLSQLSTRSVRITSLPPARSSGGGGYYSGSGRRSSGRYSGGGGFGFGK